MMTKGFSLIELMVVVAIIGIVSAIAVPAYNSYIEVARINEVRLEVAAIAVAQETWISEGNPTYFVGANVAALQVVSGGLYTRSARFISGAAPATIAVIAGPGGIATQYQITATGINELAGKGTVATQQNY